MAKGWTKHSEEQIQEWVRRYEQGESALALAQAAGVSRQTMYRYLWQRTPMRDRREVAKLAFVQNESTRAALAAQVGEKHWNWKGGESRRDLASAEWEQARADRLEMSKGRCEQCGQVADHVHHLNEQPGDHRIENLLAVCQWCHAQLHGNWPSDEELLADFNAGLRGREVRGKYGVSDSTARMYRHYARGLARGRRMEVCK